MSIEPDPHDATDIHLDPDEAVVLFDLLWRWCEEKTDRTPSRSCFESTAEGAVLHGLLADLEKQLVAPFKPDYRRIVEQARARLACRWDYPTLSG